LTKYLLVCEAKSHSLIDGFWRFSLETAAGELVVEAEDNEPGDLNRLTLLAAIRGLEAIDGPSAVTLISGNRYVIRSLTDSLPRWRRNQFVWEHFGRRVDVQHADLWRRIDRTLSIHRVEACLVSSRVVSTGIVDGGSPVTGMQAAGEVAIGSSIAACDGPHTGPPGRPGRRRPGHRPDHRPDHEAQISGGAASVAGTEASADRLRQYLLTPRQSGFIASRRRFTTADLLSQS